MALVALMDVDGVLFDFVAAMSRSAQELLGEPENHFPPAETWDFIGEQWGLPSGSYARIFQHGINEIAMLRHGTPLPGAIAGWRALRALPDLRLHVVTNIGGDGTLGELARTQRRDWLATWGFDYDAIDFTGDKGELAARYLDDGWSVVALDDAEQHLAQYRGAGVEAFVAHQRWNRHLVDFPRVLDVDDFASTMGRTLSSAHLL